MEGRATLYLSRIFLARRLKSGKCVCLWVYSISIIILSSLSHVLCSHLCNITFQCKKDKFKHRLFLPRCGNHFTNTTKPLFYVQCIELMWLIFLYFAHQSLLIDLYHNVCTTCLVRDFVICNLYIWYIGWSVEIHHALSLNYKDKENGILFIQRKNHSLDKAEKSS